MSGACELCDGSCENADLPPLLDPQLRWLWEQVGRAADRRGDPVLDGGSLIVQAPVEAEERAAAVGLLGPRVLSPGQKRRIDLSFLTEKLRVRGMQLTPGVVAAHALGRRLASRAMADAQRQQMEQELFTAFESAMCRSAKVLRVPLQEVWLTLKRNGWVARLANTEAAGRLIDQATAVLFRLPTDGARVDRRHLATAVTGNPHSLDHGTTLAGLTLALLAASGRITARQRQRDAWAAVAVDCDDVMGGLFAVGIFPVDWELPQGAIATLPPRVLASCAWPDSDPAADSWIFVTENPSIAASAAELAQQGTLVRLLCMLGKPSAVEIAAIGRLRERGWKIAVRADFDAAGIQHVQAVLEVVPDALPWRMGAADYVQSLETRAVETVFLDEIPSTPWDPELAATMRDQQTAAFEESLLADLVGDLKCGRPRCRTDRIAPSYQQESP